MNPVGSYVVALASSLFLWGLGALVLRRRGRRRDQQADERGTSVAAILARVERERTEVAIANAPTEQLPALSPGDVPTAPIPRHVPLPRRKRPYVERQSTPWPRVDLDQQPDQELMHRILNGLRDLDR